MKKSFPLVMLAVLALMLSFSSCEEETPETESLQKAVLNGRVRADINENNGAGVLEAVPENTNIYIQYNSGDLVEYPLGGYNYQTVIESVKVDDQGNFTTQIDAPIHDFMQLTITGDEFETSWTDGAGTVTPNTLFRPIIANPKVLANKIYYIDIVYCNENEINCNAD
jgi:hypothetical protein